ncbi:MFS transporter [uncultured Veillonella sp.]|uniref:MFS transporter n=1 Tax=uncultured Veillonella sp. TaxID=159268 RepID=UPI002622A0DF|nr:MFS transporter [uncultured Veillonella sp.]
MDTSTKMVGILAVGVFGILNTEMGIIGVLPYIAESYDVSLVMAASLLSVFALGVALSGPTMPLLLSKIARKPLMLLVLGIFTITSIIAAWAPSFEVLLIARLVPALLHPVYCAMAFALAASSVKKGDGPKAVAKINMGVAAGMVVGVPISNFLAAQWGLSFAFLFAALVTAIVFVLTIWQIPNDLPVEAISYGDQLKVLKKVNVWLAIIFVMALNGSIYGVYNYFVEYATTVMGFNASLVSAVLLVYGALNIVGSFMAGHLLSKFALKTIQATLVILVALYAVFIAISQSPSQGDVNGLSQVITLGIGVALVVIWGVLAGLSANITQYWITTAAYEALNFANGLFLTAANVGVIVGTTLCGVIINAWGLERTMYGGIIMLAVAMVVGSIQLLYERHVMNGIQVPVSTKS